MDNLNAVPESSSEKYELFEINLKEFEEKFWKEIIEKKLKPDMENPSTKNERKRIENELKALKNKMLFTMGFLNAIVVALVNILNMNQEILSISIGPIDMHPINLFLSICFGIVIVLQIIGMFVHRWDTFIRFLANIEIDWYGNKRRKSNPPKSESIDRTMNHEEFENSIYLDCTSDDDCDSRLDNP